MKIAPYWSRCDETVPYCCGNTDLYNLPEILIHLGICTRSLKSVHNLSLNNPIFGNTTSGNYHKGKSNMGKDSPPSDPIYNK